MKEGCVERKFVTPWGKLQIYGATLHWTISFCDFSSLRSASIDQIYSSSIFPLKLDQRGLIWPPRQHQLLSPEYNACKHQLYRKFAEEELLEVEKYYDVALAVSAITEAEFCCMSCSHYCTCAYTLGNWPRRAIQGGVSACLLLHASEINHLDRQGRSFVIFSCCSHGIWLVCKRALSNWSLLLCSSAAGLSALFSCVVYVWQLRTW